MRGSDTDFSGLWVPLVTPLRDDRVDHATLATLTRRLARQGVAGFVACGSTGEAASLDEDEQLAVLDTVLAAAGTLPVVMGLSGCHLGDTQRWMRTLATRRIAGLLLAPPYYIRPAQAGVLEWFRRLADAAPAPVIVYDIPYRTGATMTRDTLLELARHPHIVALKDCGGDAAKTLALLDQDRLQVLAGEDLQIFATVAQGGAGAIAASAHVATARFADLLRLLSGGELEQARAVWRALVPWIELAFAEPNPAVVKAALHTLGEGVEPALRAPMTAASAGLCSRLAPTLARLGLGAAVSRP